MPLSNEARRAIAIRNSIKRRQMTASTPVVANDNEKSVKTPGAHRRMSTGALQAALAAGGFAEHAAR